MYAYDPAIVGTLSRGQCSRNKHYPLLQCGKGLHSYRLYQRLRGLGKRLALSRATQQYITRIDGRKIQIEIRGLPGNGLEIAYLTDHEAELLRAFPIPKWTQAAIRKALGR